jgi:hypothetical protein
MAELDSARQRLSAIETLVMPVLERNYRNLDDESIRAHLAYRVVATGQSRLYGEGLEPKQSDQKIAAQLARKGFLGGGDRIRHPDQFADEGGIRELCPTRAGSSSSASR